PYDYFGRRGRKEPEALAAASLKRVYVENRPYLVGGFCQHDRVANINKNLMLDAESIVSMSEKYIYMRKTFRKRLAF
nr:histone-lysine N-methyltransferase ATX2 [Tanacetum cinerariifolium]